MLRIDAMLSVSPVSPSECSNAEVWGDAGCCETDDPEYVNGAPALCATERDGIEVALVCGGGTPAYDSRSGLAPEDLPVSW